MSGRAFAASGSGTASWSGGTRAFPPDRLPIASDTQHASGALLLYHRPAFFPDAATITDHIDAFGRYSRFPVVAVNTDYGFPRDLANLRFDAIVVHYTVFASGPNHYLLDERFLAYLDAAGDSYKVAFFQDEHQHCRKRFAFLDRHGFDCVYTCFQPEQLEATYGTYTNVPKLVSHVPAYVHPDLVVTAERLHVPDSERPIDIGYRARPTPPYFGRGGMEKFEIGERFAERAAVSELTLDLTAREEDRLYGDDWYRFMASCRGFLGTESGVSCSDLEDEVRLEYEALVAAGEEPTIERLEQGALGRWDWKVPLRTTSSRHFEAAALRVCQVMYEGEYSGTLRPMEHYIPLRKDFSNLDEALARFRDPDLRRELTDNAYRDLIASGDHGYDRFIAGFDQTLIDAGLTPPASSELSSKPLAVTTRGRPPGAVLHRYVGGAIDWLHRNHRWAWRMIGPVAKAAWYASRPVVVPVRALFRRLSGGPATQS